MVKNLPDEIAMAASGVLSPYVPWLTPVNLRELLENHNPNAADKDARPPQKPMTRKEAADALGISVQSVDRYLTAGRLTRVQYSPRAIRISAESVYNLMKGRGL
jgi:hypothetical protein